jgi:16S rRNA (cytidine1402-2'-O)-methyltransferase
VGILYIVSTPIGNLKDITLRAIEVLGSVGYIACEDTRVTARLLNSLDIKKTPMLISFNEFTEDRKIPNIMNLLKNDQDVALVSDSGTPLISDPGFPLVREVIKNGIKVESIPGPSAITTALVVSGLPTDKYVFIGFLPRRGGNRKNALIRIKESSNILQATYIIYVAPHRLIRTLSEIQEVFGDIYLVVGRELTKKFEEVRRENISRTIKHFSDVSPKGEFVILFNLKSLEI